MDGGGLETFCFFLPGAVVANGGEDANEDDGNEGQEEVRGGYRFWGWQGGLMYCVWMLCNRLQ